MTFTSHLSISRCVLILDLDIPALNDMPVWLFVFLLPNMCIESFKYLNYLQTTLVFFFHVHDVQRDLLRMLSFVSCLFL